MACQLAGSACGSALKALRRNGATAGSQSDCNGELEARLFCSKGGPSSSIEPRLSFSPEPKERRAGRASFASRALAGIDGFVASGSNEHEQKQLGEFLRGGEDVAAILAQMADLLVDMSEMADREEALAVEMAAAAAVAGRAEIFGKSFLLALDYMMQDAEKQDDAKQVWLLQMLKQQVLFQLESRFPTEVEVVAILVTTPTKDLRLAILQQAAAAASLEANRNARSGTWTLDGASAESAAPLPAVTDVIADQTAYQVVEGAQPNVGHSDDEQQRLGRRQIPSAHLEDVIAQANDLIRFMEDDLPVRDRRLLARLLVAREEARDLLLGDSIDTNVDARDIENVPEAEVKMISQLAAIRSPELLRERLWQAMRGDAEDSLDQFTEALEADEELPSGSTICPGRFIDSITKVIAALHKAGGSALLLGQLQKIRKMTVDILHEIGHA